MFEKERMMKKALVAYFSVRGAEGITGKMAARLAGVIGADLYEISPVQPYTKADCNWMDKRSRSTVEMQDRSCRPAIAMRVENMDAYEVVFVGFPIWWYREPSIIDTFMEAYDFTGKTVVPFATSGGSSIGDSAANMQELAPGAKVVAGKRFAAKTSADDLCAWAQAWL